jgi:pSer/pThr/pTyr-binding forkhead associated (FHA) protein
MLERVADAWTVVDDGMSRNGTYLNGNKVIGRQRLIDGNRIDLGRTQLVFHEATTEDDRASSTLASDSASMVQTLSPAQRRVLVALCRPLQASASATPATNSQIAGELYLSIAAVKFHLRTVCERLGLRDLPQNEKRARLAHAALAAGLVTPRDF